MPQDNTQELLARIVRAVEILADLAKAVDGRVQKLEAAAATPNSGFHVLGVAVDRLTSRVEDLRKASEAAQIQRMARRKATEEAMERERK